MASIINASSSGSGGIVQTADASGVLQLQSNGTVSLQVDTSANVGIGTTSAGGYKLAIGDGASNRGRIMLKGATGGNYPEINIDDTMNTSGKNYQLYSTGGVLKVSNQTDAAVSFVANNYGIGLGDIAAVDGTGIRFPATQSASTNANTLDDYEEGTWTPSYNGGLTGITYGSVRSGYYRKVGSMVTIWFGIMTDGLTVTSSSLNISGLPFTAISGGGTNGTLNVNNCTRWVSNPPNSGCVEPGTTSITLYTTINTTGAGTDPTTVTTGSMATGASNRNILYAMATYFVA